MKTLYLDCGMGAAGDMLTAALLELLPEPDKFIEKMNKLGIPGVQITGESVTKCGICGTHVSVKIHGEEECSQNHNHSHNTHNECHTHKHHHNHECCHETSLEHTHEIHHHSQLHDIQHIISHLHLPEKVAEDVLAVYTLIAQAESKVHGVPVTDIHFHEVGTLDAITDITAVCLLMNEIAPDEVVVSPIHVGSGHVHCAHGILPVPAPATAEILRGVPIYSEHVRGELCTPTGAALLKHFATRFDSMPVMSMTAIGYGMGKKDFERANCIRAILGETADKHDGMYELCCNVDDMTAEQIGYALERFLKDGAVEAYTIPIGMKKSRPGTLICVICNEELKKTLIRSIFKHTSTCGIREALVHRNTLERKIFPVETEFGILRRKDYWGYGVSRSKYEYEDLARAAEENHMSIDEILKKIL